MDGDNFGGAASTLPAVAGYPHLTVPMGTVSGLPVGLSFIGAAWREAELLALGHGFEQAAGIRPEAGFAASIAPDATTRPLLQPLPS